MRARSTATARLPRPRPTASRWRPRRWSRCGLCAACTRRGDDDDPMGQMSEALDAAGLHLSRRDQLRADLLPVPAARRAARRHRRAGRSSRAQADRARRRLVRHHPEHLVLRRRGGRGHEFPDPEVPARLAGRGTAPAAGAGPGEAGPAVLRPPLSPDTEFFWAGTRAGELRIQRCGRCGALRHPPGPVVPALREHRQAGLPGRGRDRHRLQLRGPPPPSGAGQGTPDGHRACRADRRGAHDGRAPRYRPRPGSDRDAGPGELRPGR